MNLPAPQELLPSYVEHRLDFPILENHIATNAAVEVLIGQIYVLVPVMDHYVDHRGCFMPLPPGSPEPRVHYAHNITYLARVASDLSVESAARLTVPADQIPHTRWPFRGFESPRLFAWRGGLWMTLCTHGCGKCEGAEFYIGRVDGDRFANVERITTRPPPPNGSVEKNWMPEVNGIDLRFHHRLGMLIDMHGNLTQVSMLDDPSLSDYHGGSQVIPYKGDRLCVVHHYDGGTNNSHQRFVRLDPAGQVIAASEKFNFHRDITTGMAYHPDGKRMILSYGRQDAESNVLRFQEKPYLATVDLDDLGRLI